MAEREIQEAILQLSGVKGQDTVSCVECTVTSVDTGARTCDARTLSGIPISGVRLMAEIDDGLLVIPTIGSVIIVMYTKAVTPFVCQFSSIDRVLVITGDSTVEIKDGLVKFNDGSYDGFVKVGELVSKLNALENKVNSMIALYNAHVHASNGVPTTSLVTGTLQTTVQADLENTLITHGR